MASDNMIDRAGSQPVAGRKHDQRHPQSGRYIRKGSAPVKTAGSKKRPKAKP